MSGALAPPPGRGAPGARARRLLAATGRVARTRLGFLLMAAAAGWGVLREGARPGTWRRSVRREFAGVLRQAAGGGLFATAFTASVAGIGMVGQAAYWLSVAGLSALGGQLLVTVLLRQMAPVLVGVILLGRSGMLAVAELGLLQSGGRVRALAAEGIDPFAILLLPRALGLAVAGFTLGIAFILVALVAGFLSSDTLAASYGSVWSFLAAVLAAIDARDFVLIPAKMMAIGFGVGVASCLSGLIAGGDEEIESLLPRGFARGMLAVMGIDIGFMAVGG